MLRGPIFASNDCRHFTGAGAREEPLRQFVQNSGKEGAVVIRKVIQK